MVVGALSQGTEVAVIGSGPGGYLTAIRLAQLGKDVTLIEASESLGGICLNEGCIPSKALIHASDFYYSAPKATKFGITVGAPQLDFPRLIGWKESVVKRLTGGVRYLSEKNGVTIIRGYASFASERSLNVSTEHGSQTIEFEKCIIATGSSPFFPKGFEPDGRIVLGPREILSLEAVPERLVVIGGGYIGLEMAALFAKFGSKVSVIEKNDTVLRNHDSEIREALLKRFATLKIEFFLSSTAEKVIKSGKTGVEIRDAGGNTSFLEGDKVLVALGRFPNSGKISIEKTGVELDARGFIKVNEKMQTGAENIYAIGDVIGGPLLAHKAYREAKVAAEAVAGIPSAFDNVVIPAVIYTDPEIAWAGLSETEAVAAGHEVVTGMFPFHASGRALTLDAPEGFVKTIAERDSKRILGVEIVGMDASELISEAALAIEMGAFLDDLSKTIHPHPSMSEALLESAEAALGEAVHILKKEDSAGRD
ncbi:MAG TPA: dihydrolipoyl dehydrogenase [Acidobacteriota bacterium]|nr:dihydrolipoyl dehydrogenase [Acidobacteriota bacterium]HQO18742.1 dihydrolipoyl dehydrogenase [Acidobacteriota bacterium]HQQ46867.1 dihydrolipoyl dehydrogenase [Acidobacteriota bacterium]